MSARSPIEIDVFRCALAGSNLIEASAGTGKTWTLAALYLRCVLELDRPVSEILVVTYTRAATAELRDRIRTRLVETLHAVTGAGGAGADPFLRELVAAMTALGIAPDTMRLRLNRALAEFDSAAIYTIHSFCQRALGDTPIAGRVPLKLELLPDGSELVARAVADAWRRHIGSAQLTPEMASYLVQHPLTPATVGPLLERRRARPLAREIWPETAGPCASPADRLAQFRTEFAALHRVWPDSRETARALLLGAAGRLHGSYYTAESIEEALGEWDRWLAVDPVLAAEPPGSRRLRLLTQSELDRRATGKTKAPPEHPVFVAAEQVLDSWTAVDASLDTEWRLLLRRVLDDAEAALADDQRRRRVASYDDLLRNLYHALHDDPVRADALAGDLRRRFPVALIDEFQDTDPQQWAIFARVWASAPADAAVLFLVGDPKQAIYRFRHADVHTYLAARERCGTEYTLSQNQRSSAPMIAATNALFGRNRAAFMRPGLDFRPAGVGTKPRALWEAEAAGDDGALRVWLLPRAAGAHLFHADAIAAALDASAAEIARLIRDGAAGRIRIDGRGLKPADIAVLVRSHSHARRMRGALAAIGVDSVELAQESVYRSREAAELGIVLAAVAEPQDESALRAALATELLGLDAAAMIALEDAATDDFARHVERFMHYRELWRSHGFAPMWRALLAAERAVPRLLARPDGERRLTNLLHLGELLQAQPLPAGEVFLRWLREALAGRQPGGDEEASLRLESDRDLVHIVTVHKAKGLEYPVVFCPLLWAASRSGGDRLIAGTERREGEESLVDFCNDAAQTRAATAAGRRESAEEDLRLLYVALTRAVHRCYLVAGVFRTTRRSPSTKAARKRLLNWLVAGDGIDAGDWLDKDPKLDDGETEAAWHGLADAGVVVLDLPSASAPPPPVSRPDPTRLSALPWPRGLSESWRIGSFSGLMRHSATSEARAADRDESLAWIAPAAAADPPACDADDILRFPRGAMAGECLHAIFEHADFTRPDTWPAAIAAALRRFPLADGAAAQTRLAAMATRMLRDVCDSELATGLRLADLSPGKRLNEMAFTFPARVERSALAAEFAALGYPLPELSPGRLDGYLSGFIDLVFEAGGRFYLLDWKSNYLGETAEAYGQRGVGVAMTEHGYHLQAQIYAVAVQRYLAQRLPDYDFERHFGGIFYLFVRGVRPGWRDAGGLPCGVFSERPTQERLRAIERILVP